MHINEILENKIIRKEVTNEFIKFVERQHKPSYDAVSPTHYKDTCESYFKIKNEMLSPIGGMLIEDFKDPYLQDVLTKWIQNIKNPKFVVEVMMNVEPIGQVLVIKINNFNKKKHNIKPKIANLSVELAVLFFKDKNELGKFLTYMTIAFGNLYNYKIDNNSSYEL